MLAQQLNSVGRKARCSRIQSITTLRSAFFAQAGEVASRYGVNFERVVMHLWKGRAEHRKLLLRNVTHVEDLVHAIACVDDRSLAWADLAERYERTLVRRCRILHDDIAATIQVRRLFADLRHANLRHNDGHQLSMRSYAGTRPLRHWLMERLRHHRLLCHLDITWRSDHQTALRNGTCDLAWMLPSLHLDNGPLAFRGAGVCNTQST